MFYNVYFITAFALSFLSSDKREKILKTCGYATTSTASLSKATAKKKIPKSNKGKDSGTSSEEERWLDAIESGKLEEVFHSLGYFI